MDEKEREWIQKLNSMFPNGYNLTKYGDFNVNYNSIYGYHVLLNVTSFDFTGELHFYSGTNYLGLIQIKD